MTLTIDAAKLEAHIQALGQFGRTPSGGIDRPTYSPAWQAAREQVATWMREVGLDVRSDAVGSLFGRLQGTDPTAPAILSGSHIDTVPNGGAYDGALGVHAALAAVEALIKTHGQPRVSMEVVATAEEEGARFPCNFWAARAIIGAIAADEPDRLADREGLNIGQAMRDCGFDPSAISSARRLDVGAFLELHIEQGPILEQEACQLGIVNAIAGQMRATITLTGAAGHAGTTPMDLRHDSFLGAAEIALAVEEIARKRRRPAVGTVGSARLTPGVVNVIPGETVFTIDLRHADQTTLARMTEEAQSACAEIASRRGLRHTWATTMDQPPQPMDALLRANLQRAADDYGYSSMPITSGAGHDSLVTARAFPTAMLFVPSQNGRSHCPEEFTPLHQVLPGVQVLTSTLYALAYKV